MATSGQKNIVERLAGAGEEVLERIASIAAAERLVGTLGTLKERVDELQKSVRTIDRLEKRLSAIEWRLTKLEGKASTSTKSRKTSALGSKKKTAARKPGAGS
jgi:predicted  nucleic acid-binding Zn-ribbon protein